MAKTHPPNPPNPPDRTSRRRVNLLLHEFTHGRLSAPALAAGRALQDVFASAQRSGASAWTERVDTSPTGDADAAGEADGGIAGIVAEVEEKHELSRHVGLLRAVEAEPKATVRRLGEVAKIPKSTVGKMLERLQKERLVAQVLGTWELTPKGVKYLADAT